jgi:MFS superfamily sulfate permease-like transporter
MCEIWTNSGRLAGMVSGWIIFIIILVLGPVMEQLPMAGLAGVMFMVLSLPSRFSI